MTGGFDGYQGDDDGDNDDVVVSGGRHRQETQADTGPDDGDDLDATGWDDHELEPAPEYGDIDADIDLDADPEADPEADTGAIEKPATPDADTDVVAVRKKRPRRVPGSDAFPFDDDDDDDEDEELAEAPKQTNNLKWGLIAVAVLAVVAIALVAVVLLGGDPGKNAVSTKPSRDTSGIASADDTGPAAVIISDPSCGAWNAISNNLSSTLSLLGRGEWNERDQSIPATEWNDEMKKGYLAAGQVVRTAAEKSVGLVKLTPHRVMRELYEQFIAYGRAFVEHIPKYTAADASLAGTAHSAASALAAICAAADSGASAARGPRVESSSSPGEIAPPGNPSNPQRYLTAPDPVCRDWQAALAKFGADTGDWQGLDPSIPATFWNPQQKAVNTAAQPVMISFANKLQQLGRRSDNPTLQDFADLSAQYRRAFALALPTYDPSDNYLANAATFVSTTVLGACQAVGAG